MKAAPIYAPELELSSEQVDELNGLATRPMIVKIAGWMAQKGLRVTQTEVGRLIHRHTGQTPSKTTLKEAVDGFYAQALQTAMTRQSLGQIPTQVMNGLESIYLQIRQAAQNEFQADRSAFEQTVGLLRERLEEVESARVDAIAELTQSHGAIESLNAELREMKSRFAQLQEKTNTLQETATGFHNQLLGERNAHQATKLAHGVELKQLSTRHQAELDAMRDTSQAELKALTQECAAEIKRIGVANHEHTTKLLLQIDEIRAEAAGQSAKKDKQLEINGKEIQKGREELQAIQAELARVKAELASSLSRQAELDKASLRVSELESQLAENTKIIASLSASLSIAQKQRKQGASTDARTPKK